MNAQELVAEAKDEINVFERPSRNTSIALVAMVKAQIDRITELEKSRKSLIEEFAEARCLGEVAQIARGYGYDKNK